MPCSLFVISPEYRGHREFAFSEPETFWLDNAARYRKTRAPLLNPWSVIVSRSKTAGDDWRRPRPSRHGARRWRRDIVTSPRNAAPGKLHQVTSPLPEQGRQAAQVMLDCLSVWDVGADDMLNTSALNLTLRRLNDVGAVTATIDDDDNLTVNIDNLTAGVLISMLWFLTRLAEARGVDRSEVVNDLRLFLNGKPAA